MNTDWKPFFVDFNSYGFKTISSAEDWYDFVSEARRMYAENRGCPGRGSTNPVLDFLLEAKAATAKGLKDIPMGKYAIPTDKPTFGYRREHKSDISLEQWARAEGMNLRTLAESDVN